MYGWWSTQSKSLDDLFYYVCDNELKNKLKNLSWYVKLKTLLTLIKLYFFPVKTIKDSKLVALEHYNLGNELYEKMLGKYMIYSCGYCLSDNDDLDQMQLNKMFLIKEKLCLRPDMKYLILDVDGVN